MSVTDELLTGQAQHLIGALIAHDLLPKSMPSEQYLVLWDVVKRQLNAVNKEGARAIQEEAYKAGMAAQVRVSIPSNTMEQEFGRHYDRGYKAGMAAERERCATFASDWLTSGRSPHGKRLAEAMREDFNRSMNDTPEKQK
jgi:hypothetical protein